MRPKEKNRLVYGVKVKKKRVHRLDLFFWTLVAAEWKLTLTANKFMICRIYIIICIINLMCFLTGAYQLHPFLFVEANVKGDSEGMSHTFCHHFCTHELPSRNCASDLPFKLEKS